MPVTVRDIWELVGDPSVPSGDRTVLDGIRMLFLDWLTSGEEGVDVIGRDKVTVTEFYSLVSIAPKPPNSQPRATVAGTRKSEREPSKESPLRVEAEWRPIAETWNVRP